MPGQGYFTREMLTSVQTLPDAITELKTLLTGSGFAQIDDWTEGTFQHVLLQLAAFLYTQMQQRAATIVVNSSEPTASGSFLDSISESFFDNTRFPGQATIGNMVVTCSAGSGPYTFAPGQFQVTIGGLYTYANRDLVTFTSTGPVTTAFVATEVGADWNQPANQAVSIVGSIQGLSVNNPPAFPTTSPVNWYFTPGQDSMTDQGLHVLNQTKWSTLATPETPADRVINAVVSASAGAISDVCVDGSNPNGPGTVAVYCSYQQAPASTAEVSAIAPTVQGLFFNGSSLVTVSPSAAKRFGSDGYNNPVQIWYAPGTDLPTLSASLASTLNGWIASVPTGGNDYAGSLQSGGANGIADVDGLVAVLYQVPGVRKVKIGNQQDIQLGAIEKLTAPSFFYPGNTGQAVGMWPGVCGTGPILPGQVVPPAGCNLTASIF
jgi:hypothetical protein